MLDYTLIENLLTAAPDDFMAHTVDGFHPKTQNWQ
jgi:hypothetical protein